ncbi:2-methylcitrate dehydratase PrpD [Cytobacillus firmus]|uniref:2-methylcitrate dehydratase PrpD n=2 Tax=Cytobacillus TaxID=2675230 RepID=A0A366JQL7_CYTFI|nr:MULTISPECIES: MmgE/PrpD family protein [Cytobacillus]RBP90598.1 2-methylcitrate dehydratase PrpD [Cytobacillus firmus]TDX46180.1 2-methylcitrate dehydratase PrpD [Cytobacillus oceanisediminis]
MVTTQIARKINNTNFGQISGNAVYEAKRSLLNWLGVAIGAANHESMDKVLNVSKLMESTPQASILGRNEKADMLFAALLNGMSSHIYDFDDTLLETVLHPSSPVFPAVLSYSEYKKKTGKEVLEAFIIGCEVQARLALAVYPSHYWRGWHITGSVGGIGAAAAMSKLLGLDEEKTSFAIGIAATDPTGLREMFGTMTKPYHPGKASMNGMLAAFIAGEGFTSSKQALEAERGFINVLSEEAKMELLTDNWGDKWEIEKNSYKPFASGIVTHPAIDGIIAIQRAHNLKAEEVEEIYITGHPLVKELTGKIDFNTGLEGKFSVFHCVAAGFLHLKAGVNEFTDDFVNKPEVKALRTKIQLTIDENIKEDQVRLTVKLKDGRELSHFVEHAIGSMDMPMTDQQLIEKFKDVTGSIISEEAKELLIDQVYRLEEIEDLERFFQLCTPVESASHI